MADFQAAYDGQDYIEPWVSLTLSGVPTKVSCSDEHETVYTLEYQGQALVGGETNCHIWYDGSNEAFYATNTRTIEDGTDIAYLYVTEGDEYDWNDGSFSAEDVEVLESEDIDYVHYNKLPVDWDFELVWHSADTCGYQELTNFSSRVGFEEVDSSIGHWYHITGQDFTTNPISSFKVKISNCPGYDGVYTVTGDNSGQGTNEWWWTGPEGSFSLQVTVEQNNNVAKLYADFTEGC